MSRDLHDPAQETHTEAVLAALEREAERDREESVSAWGFIWVLFAFKIVTVVLIFWNDITYKAGAVRGATTWYFAIVPLFAFGGPILYRWRLYRIRRRRAHLRRAEWVLSD
jgi:hypothetical protein